MILLAIAPILIAADLAVLASAAVSAASDPSARVELVSVAPPQARACSAEQVEVPRPIEGSGSVALRIAGHDARNRPCVTWATASVRVARTVAVTTRPLVAGEPLSGAFELREIEVKRAQPWVLPAPASAAAGALPAGTTLLASHLSAGPPPGTPVRIVVARGSLLVSAHGQVAPCARGEPADAVCAVLANGRRVRGTLDAPLERGGALQVVMP